MKIMMENMTVCSLYLDEQHFARCWGEERADSAICRRFAAWAFMMPV